MSLLFDPVGFAHAAVQVMMADNLAAAGLEALRARRLANLLAHSQEASPFYRARLQGCSMGTPDLSEISPVTRAELMASFDDWVTDPAIRLKDLQVFLRDPTLIGRPFLGRYLVWESSGSSHQPGVFVQDAPAMAVFDALETIRLSPPRPWCRWLDPWCMTERIAFIGATTGHFASVVSAQRLRLNHPLLREAVHCFSILQPAADLLRALNEFAPTVLTTYPSVAVWLAEAYASGGLAIAPREVWVGGETLSPRARRQVKQAFGCEVRNSYGASEFLPMAWECRAGNLHLNTDWLILEPVDAQGCPTPPGQRSHSTLLTSLVNRVQPIIRYDLGDRIRMVTAPCACGSIMPVVEVQGRQDDALHMAGLDGRLVTLLPMALTTVLEEEAGLFDFQICQQDAHTLVLRLAICGEEAAHALMRGRQALLSFVQAQSLAPIELRLESGKALRRGRSGKVQRILAREPT